MTVEGRERDTIPKKKSKKKEKQQKRADGGKQGQIVQIFEKPTRNPSVEDDDRDKETFDARVAENYTCISLCILDRPGKRVSVEIQAQSWPITITRREEVRDRAIYSHGEESSRVQRAAPLLRVNSPPLGAPTCDATGLMNGLAVSCGKAREVRKRTRSLAGHWESYRERSSISGRRQARRSRPSRSNVQ